MEATGEVEPVNAGKDQTGVQHTDGNWYHWNEAWWRQETNTCVSGYEYIAAYINFGTC